MIKLYFQASGRTYRNRFSPKFWDSGFRSTVTLNDHFVVDVAHGDAALWVTSAKLRRDSCVPQYPPEVSGPSGYSRTHEIPHSYVL